MVCLSSLSSYSIEHSYEILKNTPSVLLDDPKVVIAIPSYFHTGWTIANGTLEDQVNS